MTRTKTRLVAPLVDATPQRFTGLLAGLEAGPVVNWGLLEVVSLRLAPGVDAEAGRQFASPDEHLELVQVADYGTVILRNASLGRRLIVPMHIGFFQADAQNHATSRVLVLEPTETLTAKDCFCIQAEQGGLLKESQQRFLMLPLGLRRQALVLRNDGDYSRLWGDIDGYTRHHGVPTGGHLERFLRPNFARLLPLRHAIESVEGQIGAAYFIGGRLAGVEVVPNEAYWRGIAPVLAMYCYGPAALLAEQRGYERVSEPLDLEGLAGLDDLAARLHNVRAREAASRAEIVEELSTLALHQQADEERHGLTVATMGDQSWAGQVVREGRRMVYASVFRDVVSELGRDAQDATPAE